MIPFVKDMTFEYGACDQVSPLIRRVVANNPGPFSYLGTATFIIGRGQVAIIDPGPDLPEHLEAILAATAGETITDILITHHHSDHSPLAAPLKARTGARIHGCPPSRIGAADGIVVEAASVAHGGGGGTAGHRGRASAGGGTAHRAPGTEGRAAIHQGTCAEGAGACPQDRAQPQDHLPHGALDRPAPKRGGGPAVG